MPTGRIRIFKPRKMTKKQELVDRRRYPSMYKHEEENKNDER